MMNQIEIKKVTSMQELPKIQQLEKSVWNMPPTPVHQTFTALNNGGIILGAYDGDEVVGFLYSFAGFDGKNSYLCSHMLGILESYRKGGFGVQMKWRQAEIAKNMGYPYITWTFDPLESLNAYLNLHKLGATGAYYKENHYGEMKDDLNQGLPTDRIQIIWHLDDYKSTTKKAARIDKNNVLLTNEANKPAITEAFRNDISNNSAGWFAAVPMNFQHIKREDIELAKSWRYATRKVFQALFSHGYQATDLINDREKGISYYYFSRN
jgi:predicted GNAT superfamily acetyltransferase